MYPIGYSKKLAIVKGTTILSEYLKDHGPKNDFYLLDRFGNREALYDAYVIFILMFEPKTLAKRCRELVHEHQEIQHATTTHAPST